MSSFQEMRTFLSGTKVSSEDHIVSYRVVSQAGVSRLHRAGITLKDDSHLIELKGFFPKVQTSRFVLFLECTHPELWDAVRRGSPEDRALVHLWAKKQRHTMIPVFPYKGKYYAKIPLDKLRLVSCTCHWK